MNPYIQLPKVPVVNDRQRVILAKSKGKRVLHLGCVDAGLLHERFERKELMHQRLATVASELWGVDIDAEGISFLCSQGFGNLVVGDICELDRMEALQGQTFDVIVASEIIEHLQNPGFFLNAVGSIMVPGETELIITVPNAFRIDTLIWLLRGIEYVHPDHNYWFSYHTVTNLIRKNGFEIREMYVYSFQRLKILPKGRSLLSAGGGSETANLEVADILSSAPFLRRTLSYFSSLPKRFIVSLLYKRTPFWGDGLIIVAQRNAYD